MCMLSHFSHIWLCLTLWTVAHQTPLSMGILQARTLEVKSLSHIRLFATPWTVAYQASLSVGFSRQGYWNGLPFPSPGNLPDPGIEPGSPALQTDALPSGPPGKPKNTGAGCYFLLQGIFPTQGLNSGISHCRQTLYPLSHQGKPNYIQCLIITYNGKESEKEYIYS